jgi:hypothetical protein
MSSVAARVTPSSCALLLLLAAAAAAAADGAGPRPGAARISVETVVVDRQGTWSAGSDVADVFPGSAGVLNKSVTLQGRLDPGRREALDLTARIAPSLRSDGACSLRLETEVRSAPAGGRTGSRPASRPERRTITVDLRPEEDRLVEVYASSLTHGRLALKVRCGAPEAMEPRLATERPFIEFLLSVARADGDGDPRPLKSNGLRALLGLEASNLFSFNVPLAEDEDGEKRYRREKLEVTLSPVLISAGRVQIEMRIGGELATVSATAATVAHPIDRRETLVLAPGEPHRLDFEITAAENEGWTRVRYRLEIVCRF